MMLETLGITDLALRLFLAVLFGFLIGLDRDLKNKPVDFRAYIITCAATCLLAVFAMELSANLRAAGGAMMDDQVAFDLGKVISGALTGIGFLGAGAIIKTDSKDHIVGTATGASIWASAIIGLCLGFGFYILALAGFITVAVVLQGLGYYKAWLERRNGDKLKGD